MLHLPRWSCALLPVLALQLLVTQAIAADAIRVRLDWTPWGDQAPFHLAQQSGLFKKYDLDVSIDVTRLHFTAGGPSAQRDLNVLIGKNVQAGRIMATSHGSCEAS